MSDGQQTPETTASSSHSSAVESISKAQSAIEALIPILPSVPPPLSSSENPAFSILHDPEIASQISSFLRQPDSGAGDNNLCRWLYDTFQSSHPDLQLVVLRFLPIIAGVYLSRIALRKPLAGFEAVLLALYAHETTARGGQPVTVNVPDLSHPSIYHESKTPIKNNATGLNMAILSPTLEPHGTVRSTRRARIVGVSLELYYRKISLMPVKSKLDFCEFCLVWAGQDGDMYKDDHQVFDNSTLPSPASHGGGDEGGEKAAGGGRPKEGRIPLTWELLQPMLRILGHCVLGPSKNKQLIDAAIGACRSLYARALHEIDARAIQATGSLLRLGKMRLDSDGDSVDDPTEIPKTNVICL